MSIFSGGQLKAVFSGGYIGHGCGRLMGFEGELGDTLVCPRCGHGMDLDDAGREGYGEDGDLYPAGGGVLGIAGDDSEGDSDDFKHKLSRRGS